MVNLLSNKDLSSEEKLEKLNNINDRSDFINSFDKLFIPEEITNSRTNTQEKTQTKDEEEEEPKEFNNINQKIEPKENKEIKKPKFIINHIHKNKIKDIKGKKHTNKYKDNFSKKVIIHCMKMTHNFILKQIRLFFFNNKKIKKFKYNLNIPTLTFKLKEINEKKIGLFKQTVKTFYLNYSVPRKKGKNTFNKNKAIIEQLEECNDSKIKILLNTQFNEYLITYLNDEQTITSANYEINDEFKTFNKCFNDEYTSDEKDKIKKYLLSWTK